MSLLIYQPQLTVPGDGSGMTEQQIATLSLAAARGGHIFTPLDANYGAVGDGTDEAAKIQACVDEAMASPGNTVVLNPPVTFGVGSVIDFDGTYPVDVIGTTRHFSTDACTLTKTADTVALRVPAAAPRVYFNGISIKGRGGANPSTTPDGKPAILIHARCRMRDMYFYRCGGLAGLGETNTTGFVIGVLQLAELDNCNSLDLDDLAFLDCSGDGLFIQRLAAGNGNVNAIYAFIRRFFNNTGYAVNTENGFRNTFMVRTYEKGGTAAGPGVFRLSGVENEARVIYAEGGADLLVHFSSTGRRSKVYARSFGEFTSLYNDIYNNHVVQDEPGPYYLGDGSSGSAMQYIGGNGVTFDAIKLPTPLATGYGAIQEAVAADFGSALDLYSTGSGTVTKGSPWECYLAKVGMLCMATIRLAGDVNVASTAASRLRLLTASTGIGFRNGGNLHYMSGFLSLTNSNGTQLVLLRFVSTELLQFYTAAGVAMTFNDVVGTGAFTINGLVSFMDAQGQA